MKELILSHGPCKPTGPFEDNKEDGRPIFYTKHYYFNSTGNIQIARDWLCFSPILKMPYCQTCWLFADRTNVSLQWAWINGVEGSSKHHGVKIKRHECSSIQLESTAVHHRWKSGNKIDKSVEREIRNQANFWKDILARLVNIILKMAELCLAFRGHREMAYDGICTGGNFLDLVSMQAEFDPVLKELINRPKGKTKVFKPCYTE